ncbi:HNH endonuclease family protein [Rubrobacter indicoceani]|uniref:HNH endonuclease family protein n=1 Tax=Rubrobacter indicoceani TaxID=2051957 RepID=UPI000E5A1106|nr:HNH endonuclease family protein [Rubrobacter indicoceani]
MATAIGGLLIVGLALYFGASPLEELLGDSTSPSGSSSVGTVGSVSEAGEVLANLPVERPGSMSGYSREAFPHWSDGAENGWDVPSESCDTRDAALIRDGENVAVGESCSIDSGTWVDPYAGETNTDSSDVDIDHVVPLANAWRSGAKGWDEAKRERFANAPDNLLASDAGENRSKGDRGPEAWRPPDRSAWCDYAIRWTRVKSEYQLSVNPDEKASLEEMLETCGAA